MEKIQLVISNEAVEVEVKEYQGQRVVTLRDVDNLHKRNTGVARKNFNFNKKYFVEGEDYIVRNSDEAHRELGMKAPNGLILLTESGYLMLVKSFTDELAWNVQRQLINAYFKVKTAHQEQQIPTSHEDIMIFALQSQKEMKAELVRLNQRDVEQTAEIRKLSLVVDNEIHLTDIQCAEVQEAVKHRVGHLMSQGYEPHFASVYSELKVFFTVPKYNKIRRGDFDKAIDFIKGWYPKKNNEAN